MFSQQIKELVLRFLAFSRLRDDDRRLTATVWNHVLLQQGLDPKATTAFQFFEKYAEGEVPHAESIRRTRQKLQESNPKLRGEKYQDRKEKLEPAVRNMMRERFSWQENQAGISRKD